MREIEKELIRALEEDDRCQIASLDEIIAKEGAKVGESMVLDAFLSRCRELHKEIKNEERDNETP